MNTPTERFYVTHEPDQSRPFSVWNEAEGYRVLWSTELTEADAMYEADRLNREAKGEPLLKPLSLVIRGSKHKGFASPQSAKIAIRTGSITLDPDYDWTLHSFPDSERMTGFGPIPVRYEWRGRLKESLIGKVYKP